MMMRITKIKHASQKYTYIDPNMNGRPSAYVHLLYRVHKPPKVSMDHVRKRHPNRPVVLAEENVSLQDRIGHIFAHVPGGLGEPRDLRNDSTPREVGSVVQNDH